MTFHEVVQSLDVETVISALVALAVGMFGMARWLVGRLERSLDHRFAAMEQARSESSEQWRASFAALDLLARENERRLTQLLIDLPLKYQQRDDAIRQEVAIIHRLDALGVKVDAALNCPVKSCPLN